MFMVQDTINEKNKGKNNLKNSLPLPGGIPLNPLFAIWLAVCEIFEMRGHRQSPRTIKEPLYPFFKKRSVGN